jgi:Glycosyl transferase family 90
MRSLGLCIILLLCGAIRAAQEDYVGIPVHIAHIPVYQHRHFGGTPVSRNRLSLLGGLAPTMNDSNKVTVQQLRQILQCAPDEPDIVGDRGSILLARMVPPTRETTRLLAVWGETLCDGWAACRKELERWDRQDPALDWGGERHDSKGIMTSPYQARLLRITNGKLYYDWPFHNKARFAKSGFVDPTKSSLIQLVLEKVSDIWHTPPFFFGEEVAFLPHSFPFYAFSSSPTMRNADMPWPWHAHVVQEVMYFLSQNGSTQGKNVSIDDFDQEDWGRRQSKAVFYGSMSQLRHIFFDVAAANPDLFDVGWTGSVNSRPWNPASTEVGNEAEFQIDGIKKLTPEERRSRAGGTTTAVVPGFLKSLLATHIDQGVPYSGSHKYKYIVVLIGGSDHASADRLAELMMNSGAVILLQKHDFEYHFSSRLKPYVHFVPLTYTAADAPQKIRWLQQNDHLAKTLAKNARNFALSHLRLEDIVCYAASALKTMACDTGCDWKGWEPIPVPSNRGQWS